MQHLFAYKLKLNLLGIQINQIKLTAKATLSNLFMKSPLSEDIRRQHAVDGISGKNILRVFGMVLKYQRNVLRQRVKTMINRCSVVW